jgi:tetratricopeptide (TPR) repeat protein
VRAHTRTAVWRDEGALFQASFEASPHSPYVAWGHGRVLLDAFRRTGDPELLARAGAAFTWSQDLGLPDPETQARDESIFVTPEDRLQANLGMGWFYLFSGLVGHEDWTFEDAELVFGKTLEGFADSEEAYVGRAVARMRLGRDDEARADLERAIAINERHPEAWYYSGDLYAQQGRPAEAAGAYERFLELRPDDGEALCRYAGALAEAGRGGAARQALERARALAPDDPGVPILEGVLAAREQRYEEALRHLEAALRLDPTNGEAWRQKGKVLLQQGDARGGFDALRRACQFAPTDFEAHYNLSVLLLDAGQVEAALPYLERAAQVATDPDLRQRLEEQLRILNAPPEDG